MRGSSADHIHYTLLMFLEPHRSVLPHLRTPPPPLSLAGTAAAAVDADQRPLSIFISLWRYFALALKPLYGSEEGAQLHICGTGVASRPLCPSWVPGTPLG